MLKMIQDVLAAEAQAIQSIPADNPFVECVAIFLESKHKGGKLVISGVGKAGEVGKKMATTFCSVGLPSIFLHPLEAQHGDLGVLHENDTLFLISNSGKTREVIELEWLAKRLYQNIKVVTMTGNVESDLAKKSDFVLWTGSPQEVCPLGLAPTTSTTTMVVIGDVLATLIVHISGYKASDYALRHHSGYLGEKSKHDAAHLEPTKASAQLELKHVYEALHRENVDFQTNNWLLDELEYLKSWSLDSILEVGCGNGLFSLAATKYFKSVTAIDWVASPVISEQVCPENLDYRNQDILQSNLPSVSAVVSADFLEHFKKYQLPDLIAKLAHAGHHQLHKIACYPDSRGLHCTVESPEYWLSAFQKVDSNFTILKTERRRNRDDQLVVTIVRGFRR